MSFFWIGTKPTLIILDPELMKEVLSDKHGRIQKPPRKPHIKLLSNGLSSLQGEKWVKQRKLISPAFHQEKLKGMTPAFLTSCIELIEKWKKKTYSQGYCELDAWHDIQDFTADVISRTAFGSNFEEGKKIFELQKEQSILVMQAVQSVYIPGFRFIPTKENKRRMNLDKEIVVNLRDLIRRKTLALESGKSSVDDLLGILLQCSRESSQADMNNLKTTGMPIDQVTEECKLFYFAGQETSSNLLTWTMIVLAIHPSWQEKAREEVLQICGKNMPSYEDLNHLKIVTMILYEVLRLYPPLVQQIRYTCKTTKLLIHHDREFWGDDAEDFRPERFSEGISKVSKDQKVAFFPFGWGPRICIGQNFAMIEAKMALAMILQHFSFQLSPSYAHAPNTITTLQPQHGAQIILHAQ
ncbi:hypothetical protein IFM89_001935 [Coptis chinensis]|uniref:Cytochrome P450 n=1 Tax=Coptis chinensis TaxID=261450 RepID=A0A835LQU2_9MAGN|nr:hypothetical protein IFM89_001935 [Coptis chinensis]